MLTNTLLFEETYNSTLNSFLINEEGVFNPLGVALYSVLRTDIPYQWDNNVLSSDDYKINHEKMFSDFKNY